MLLLMCHVYWNLMFLYDEKKNQGNWHNFLAPVIFSDHPSTIVLNFLHFHIPYTWSITD